MAVQIETSPRELPAITRHPDTQAFEEAARAGRFLVPQCQDCGRHHWHPRPFCPFCFSSRVHWVEGSGRGTVYTFSRMRAAKPAYVIAYVQLAEGPKMMSNIVGCNPEEVSIGMPVQVVFHRSGDGPLVPMFRPCAG